MRAGMVIAASRLSAPPVTLGDIVLEAGQAFLYLTGLPFHKQRALYRIAACGTGVLGWYLRECDQCGAKRAAGRQCNDRNCPTCGAKKSIAWIKARESEILPCPYFHCVFTLPDELRTVAMENEKVLYNLLFTASRETLLTFAADKKYLGATPSMFQVLHTATRSLDYHPHCHVAISAGGYDAADDRWIPTKNPRFLFPIKAVSKVFRGKFLEALAHAYQGGDLELTYTQHDHLQDPAQFQALLDQLYRENWHVYTKRAFGGPSRSSDTSANTPTRPPSRTTRSDPSTTAWSPSPGPAAVPRRRSAGPFPSNSSFSSTSPGTSSPRGSTASDMPASSHETRNTSS
jgi:hypothetical protein